MPGSPGPGEARRGGGGLRTAAVRGSGAGRRAAIGPVEVEATSAVLSIVAHPTGAPASAGSGTSPGPGLPPAVRRPSSRAAPRRPGPQPDAALVAWIGAVLATSPFHGEGHRKVRARLRHKRGRTSKERMRRLMRETASSADTGRATPRGPRADDATIIPETVDTPDRWGTDMTASGHASGRSGGTWPPGSAFATIAAAGTRRGMSGTGSAGSASRRPRLSSGHRRRRAARPDAVGELAPGPPLRNRRATPPGAARVPRNQRRAPADRAPRQPLARPIRARPAGQPAHGRAGADTRLAIRGAVHSSCRWRAIL